MIVLPSKTFKKDLRKISLNQKLGYELEEVINTFQKAEYMSQIKGIERLKGHENFYRFKPTGGEARNYRIGFSVEADTIYLVRVLHRKDFYREFP